MISSADKGLIRHDYVLRRDNEHTEPIGQPPFKSNEYISIQTGLCMEIYA